MRVLLHAGDLIQGPRPQAHVNLIQQINRYNNDSNPYLIKTNTEDPRYNDHVGYQRFYSKIEFAVIKKPDMDPSKT